MVNHTLGALGHSTNLALGSTLTEALSTGLGKEPVRALVDIDYYQLESRGLGRSKVMYFGLKPETYYSYLSKANNRLPRGMRNQKPVESSDVKVVVDAALNIPNFPNNIKLPENYRNDSKCFYSQPTKNI